MTTEAAVQGAIVTTWMRDVAEVVKAESGHLTQLDAAIGDGDHGVNMERGFSAVEKALAGQNPEVPPGRLLIVAGKTLVSTVGGASGPLWGVALRRAGRSLGDGIVELGAAAPGDKTMVDALVPAVEMLNASLTAGKPLDQALALAADAAEDGAKATVPMQARKGRASYLGERSIGHQDPGATSSALIVRALARAVSQAG